MVEIRLSKKDDVPYLKNMWKACFGDDDTYIDFFFENKYKEDQTFVLLYDKEIAAMLTMIPIKIVMPNNKNYSSTMLYAIATYPQYQGKGLSTQIMEYTKKYLLKHKIDILTLVPAEKSLIKFYSSRGYRDGFYIRESKLTYETIQELKIERVNNLIMEPASAENYNKTRNEQLQGRIFVEYANDEIVYQKKISKKSGADIYIISKEDVIGCLVAERINNEKVIIKELLVPEHRINEVLINVTKLLPAQEYILRLPGYVNKAFYGPVRVFGMIQLLTKLDTNIWKEKETFGYLGFAYD